MGSQIPVWDPMGSIIACVWSGGPVVCGRCVWCSIVFRCWLGMLPTGTPGCQVSVSKLISLRIVITLTYI